MGARVLFPLVAGLATALLLQIAGVAGPLALPLLVAVPLPAAYLHLRQGASAGAGAVILAALLLSLGGWRDPLEYLVLFGAGSFALPLLLLRGLPWDRAAAGAVLATLACAVPLIALIALDQGVGVNTLVRQYVDSEVARAMVFYQEAGLPAEQLEEIRRGGDLLVAWMPRLYPALCTLGSGLLMLILAALLRRLPGGSPGPSGPAFHQWKLPEPLVWVLIGAGFFMLVPSEATRTVGLNLLIVLVPLYFLQGMAVVSSFLLRKGASPLVRGLVYFLAVALSPLPLFVTGVGIFDLWADFRKPRKPKN